ncbi:MAG: hypothetical protein PHE83_16235 [Opitutaceae bacterium]|nr:hypothetical protein [Opitutaceae bacterium]
MNELWQTRLGRLAQVGQKVGRRLERAAVASVEWHDRHQARQRQKFLRQGWIYSTMLGLWLVVIALSLVGHQSPALIHELAGVGLFFLALKIWHSAVVIRAKKRGELS